MDIYDEVPHIGIGKNRRPFERPFKQAASPAIPPVERPGVCIEEIGETLRYRRAARQRMDLNGKVKVIDEEAIGEGVNDGGYVFDIELQEVVVIPVLKEEVRPVISPVVDVVRESRMQPMAMLHGVPPQ